MTDFITVKGGLLTAHFGHRDPLETCLAFRRQYSLLLGLEPIPYEDATDVMIEMASRFGQCHEDEVIAELNEKYGSDLCSIGQQDDDAQKSEQHRLTLEAMQQGKRLIHSGFLKMSGRSAECASEVQQRFNLPAPVMFWGEPDLLRRVDEPNCGSRFGDYYYVVADVKSSRTSKLPARLQVAFYSWLLNDAQEFFPEFGFVLPRAKEPDEGSVTRWEKFAIESVLPIAELFVRDEYWKIALADPANLVSTTGYDKPLAKQWADSLGMFGDTLAESDISLLPNMRLPARRRLLSQGTQTIDQLAKLADDELESCIGPGATSAGLRKQRTQAQVCVSGRPLWREHRYSDIQAIVNSISANEDLGDEMDVIPLDDPSIPIVHFDIEGHPFREIEYLFGYQVDLPCDRPRERDQYDPVIQIWAEQPSPNEEQRAFETFLTQMESIEQEYGDLIIIHYATYEATRLKMLAERYPTSLDSRDNKQRVESLRRRLLDLYRVVQRGFYFPFASYSIKDVAPGLTNLPAPGGPDTGHGWLKFSDVDALQKRLASDGWSGEDLTRAATALNETAKTYQIDVGQLLDASANMSVFWYEQYCESGEPIWKHMINVYNADDLVATQRLYDYLLRLQRSGLSGIETVSGLDVAGPTT